MRRIGADIAIIGSGPGGATMAWALRQSGAQVVVIERGGYLPHEQENWDVSAVFGARRYRTSETWDDLDGGSIAPGVHYFVGGNSKLWGAALPRFMPSDFEQQTHVSGVSPAWPYSYAELEPYYEEAERLYGVHGSADWGTPARRVPLLPPVGHEPAIARVVDAFRRQGLHPYDLPVGIDLGAGGRCIRCATCDGFPCMIDAKNDAEIAALRPALSSESVELVTGVRVDRLVCRGDGSRVACARGVSADGDVEVAAERFVVAAGAVNSAALLLRSSSADHPRGLANSSDMLGRNYMHHVTSAVMAVDPRRRNPTRFQKSFGINDWYRGDADFRHPMGNVQGVNKIQPGMLAAAKHGIPGPVTRFLTSHSLDLWVQSEDLPDPDNRVVIRNGRIGIRYRKNNVEAHEALLDRTRTALRRAGFPLVLIERMGIATNSHQCGTCRANGDAHDSVLDATCRTHDVENLWVVDSSFMPSSAALNPGLTIAANALRVADRAFLNTRQL
jgi:choline dehydrogenase-like flavoprotein